MPRPRMKNRDEALEKYLKSDGKLTTKILADEAGVTPARVREWRSKDKWAEALEKYRKENRKPGGQPGNKNAKGHGAPPDNTNAEKSGAFKAIRMDKLPPEEQERIKALINSSSKTCLLAELQVLYAKEAQLEQIIAENYGDVSVETMWTDKTITTNNNNGESDTTIRSSTFQRRMTIEAELNKVHGRIIKLLDSLRNMEMDTKRFELDQQKHSLMKQKAAGEFEYDESSDEIVCDRDDIEE